MKTSKFVTPAIFAFISTATSQAALVSLTPTQINGGDTSTSNFDNGEVSITPFIGSTVSTFNANAARLGIDDVGSNNNAFNDPDTDPNNGNEEKLQLIFQPSSGLTAISWDFSRADGPGPNDGVFISGFTSDPGATISGVGTSTFNYNAGILELDLTGADFGGTLSTISLSNPGASAGQTLTITTTDTTQVGAQFAIRGISYENAVPEPSTLGLLVFAAFGLNCRRRH